MEEDLGWIAIAAMAIAAVSIVMANKIMHYN